MNAMKYLKMFHSQAKWLLLGFVAVIFFGGLYYNHTISKLNSELLNDVENKALPILKKSNVIALKLTSIQDEIHKAVTRGDEAILAKVVEEGRLFLQVLLDLESLVKDKETIRSIRSHFTDYVKKANDITYKILIHDTDLESAQGQVEALNKRAMVLSDEIETLNLKSEQDFNLAMDYSRRNSGLMIRVNFWSSVGGVLLMAGVFIWIAALNRRLLSANLNLGDQVEARTQVIARLNERLSEANENLEKEVKSRTQELEDVVYTMSHDLKTPVVSIQGMGGMFLKYYGERLDEKGKHYIYRIISNTNYMEELIIGLLTLSQVGRKQGETRLAEAREVIKKVLSLHAEQFLERKIEVMIQASLPRFVFNHLLLTQLFENLISNAVKFMGNQSHPRIEIGGRELKEGVEIYVRDNGIGIDPAYHEKVFSIFQRLKDVEADGTGIGLSIVKKIIDLAGGKIWIESKKGEGTTFFFQLPQKKKVSHP